MVWYGIIECAVHVCRQVCSSTCPSCAACTRECSCQCGGKTGCACDCCTSQGTPAIKTCLADASAGSCRHSSCRHRRCEAATAVTAAVVPAVAVSTADIRACSLSVVTSLHPVTTSLGDPHSATRSLASALCCGVTVTGLRAHGTLLCESEAVVHETTVTSGIDRVTIHELLLAQRRPVANGDEPGTFEGTHGRKSPPPPHNQL